MARFGAQEPTGTLVQELEVLVRRAVFKPANELVGHLLQSAADRIDAAYQPKPGEVRKGRVTVQIRCLFGSWSLSRDYYYHAGKDQGHYPADAALGLEVGYTPALARILCLEWADETSYQKAEVHLAQTGGIPVSARQIQRVVQRVPSCCSLRKTMESPRNPGPSAPPFGHPLLAPAPSRPPNATDAQRQKAPGGWLGNWLQHAEGPQARQRCWEVEAPRVAAPLVEQL
jgi:hypothetical protein